MPPTGTARPNHLVEMAFIDEAVRWGEYFVADQERLWGIPPRSIPVPMRGQFTTTSDTFEKWPGTVNPSVLIMAPGLAGRPRREADRTYTAPVAVGIGVIVSASIPGAAREIAEVLGAAYRELFLSVRYQMLPGLVDSIEYVDERYADVPGVQERTKAGCRLVFTVWVKGWAEKAYVPDEPPEDPYDEPTPNPIVENLFPIITNARSIE